MIIEFQYTGDVSWMTAKERHLLEKALLEVWDFEYFDMTSKVLTIGGSYDTDDTGVAVHEDIEYILNKFDVDWDGKAEESDGDRDWDRMPGGYDEMVSNSLFE